MNDREKNSLQDEEDKSGSGGQTGEIHFRYRDVMSVEPRDDALPLAQIKHLQAVHYELHKGLVDKQKNTRKERAAAKEGKLHLSANNQYGLGQSSSSQFKEHWMSQLAKNSGRDKQVIGVPTLNEANTNNELKAELENRLENRLRHQHIPKFNPRPQMR